jgi:hypothetical protein
MDVMDQLIVIENGPAGSLAPGYCEKGLKVLGSPTASPMVMPEKVRRPSQPLVCSLRVSCNVPDVQTNDIPAHPQNVLQHAL